MALVFLHLQAFGQFLRLELDGFARTPLTQPPPTPAGQVEQQHRQRQGVGANIGPQAESAATSTAQGQIRRCAWLRDTDLAMSDLRLARITDGANEGSLR